MKKIIERVIDRTPERVKRLIPRNLKSKIKGLFPWARPHDSGATEHQHASRGKSGYFPGHGYLDPARYEEKWVEFFGHRREDYFAMHKRRYYELFSAFSYFYRDMKKDSLVLEVGVSEFLLFYKHFFPGIRLVTVDRPRVQNGFEASYCLEKGGAERHYEIDLNRDELSAHYGYPPLGNFAYVVCTEVLEHLIVNPVEFLKSLLSLLDDDGKLYLTTPNFFRHENLRKIGDRINPLMIYPPKGKNFDAHHHFREFAMPELLGFVEEAGGRTIVHYFSDCWDTADPGRPAFTAQAEQRSNLVIVIQRGLP